MNANQLINMVVRMFVRKAMNYGVKSGVDALNRRDSAGRARPQQEREGTPTPPKFNSRQAQQMARMARKMGRF